MGGFAGGFAGGRLMRDSEGGEGRLLGQRRVISQYLSRTREPGSVSSQTHHLSQNPGHKAMHVGKAADPKKITQMVQEEPHFCIVCAKTYSPAFPLTLAKRSIV